MSAARRKALAVALENYLATFAHVETRADERARLSHYDDEKLERYLALDAQNMARRREAFAETDRHAVGAHYPGELCAQCVQENFLRMAHHA